MRVLCVEDEAALREDMVEYLRMKAYEVDEAESGEQAIDQLNRNRYDLVLCDIKMPRMDGYELLRQVRGENHLTTTPFLFLSALNDRDDKIRAHETGCDGYLTKPIDFSVLDATLKSYIERQRSRDFLHNSALDSAQRHVMTAIDDSLSGPVSEACLIIQHIRDTLPVLTPGALDNYLVHLQDKVSSHVSGLHMFHSALGMQSTPTEAVGESLMPDELIRLAVEECRYNNPSSTIVHQAPNKGDSLIHGDMRMLQRALAGVLSAVPESCISDALVHIEVGNGYYTITVSDKPEMAHEADFTAIDDTTNLAVLSYATRHRLISLSYALQVAQAHNGRLELMIWPEDVLAVRFVLPQPNHNA